MSSKKNFLNQFAEQIATKSIHSVDFLSIWMHYDKDHSGRLDSKELDRFLTDLLQVRGAKASKDTVVNCRKEILANVTIDRNQDGMIELGEFSRILPMERNFLTYFNTRNKLARDEFNKLFSHYDKDKSGHLGGVELLALLRDIFMKIGEDISSKDLEEYRDRVLAAYDYNHDKHLSRDELGLLISVTK